MPAYPKPALADLGLAALAPESRVVCTPWSRLVRGLALGQYPTGFDDSLASVVAEATTVLSRKIPAPEGYLRFSLLLADLAVQSCRPGAGSDGDGIKARAVQLMEALRAETNPYYAVVGAGILFDAFAKLRLDVSLLVNAEHDFASKMLATVDRIESNQIKDGNLGNQGDYEKLFAYTSIFLGLGQAGLEERLVRGSRNHVRKALDLVRTIPSPFFRGRGCAMLFSVLSVIGLDGMIFDDGRDFMKEVLDYVDRDDETAVALRFPQPISAAYVKIYPRVTMLNAIAVSGRWSYATAGHDRLAELKQLWAALDPPEKMHQGLYYLIALHNLGRTRQEIGHEGGMVEELVGYLDVVDPGANFFLNGLSHAYVVETAMVAGRLDAISGRAIDRMADCFVRMNATPLDRVNRAYPFSYDLNALAEVGEAGRLFEPRPAYGNVSAFSWLVDQFSAGGRAEGSRLLMLGNALIGLGLRLRGEDRASTPMFERHAVRVGWTP